MRNLRWQMPASRVVGNLIYLRGIKDLARASLKAAWRTNAAAKQELNTGRPAFGARLQRA
jgi:hypothetical protein